MAVGGGRSSHGVHCAKRGASEKPLESTLQVDRAGGHRQENVEDSEIPCSDLCDFYLNDDAGNDLYPWLLPDSYEVDYSNDSLECLGKPYVGCVVFHDSWGFGRVIRLFKQGLVRIHFAQGDQTVSWSKLIELNIICHPARVRRIRRCEQNHNVLLGQSSKNTDEVIYLLRSIGMGVFATYYTVFADLSLSDEEAVGMLPDKYTWNSRRSRVSKARRLIHKGLDMDALVLISQSERVDPKAVARARQLLSVL
ncbi:MAG: hypothetical protein FD169_2081 [Bacillota bacterium]|nr:MAG: hypothetical protein FD169_2081 [Bacillota bacterium]